MASPLYLLCIAGMAFADEFANRLSMTAYLIVLHVIMGAAQAGVALAAGNIVIKLSPKGAATGFMATNAIVVAIASGIAPLVGGWLTDFFARRQLRLSLDWTNPSGTADLFRVGVQHWEFFFLISAALGLYALHRLSVVTESGSVEGRQVINHIIGSARDNLRNISSVGGVRQALAFPAGALIKSRESTRFLLEALFERHHDERTPPPAKEAVGSILGATFKPIVDRDFDALVQEPDKPSAAT